MALTGLLPGAVVTFRFLSFSARMFVCKMELHVFLLLCFLFEVQHITQESVVCMKVQSVQVNRQHSLTCPRP